jgi:hypothetical protein
MHLNIEATSNLPDLIQFFQTSERAFCISIY